MSRIPDPVPLPTALTPYISNIFSKPLHLNSFTALYAKMSDHNGIMNASNENINPSEAPVSAKGKGKAIDLTSHDMSMDEDEESSEEEDGPEEEVSLRFLKEKVGP